MKLPRSILFETLLLATIVRSLLLYIYYPVTSWEEVNFGWEFGQIARNLAEGRGFSSPFSNSASPTAWFSPLGPGLLSWFFEFFGVYSDNSLLAALILQSLTRVATCLIYLLIVNETLYALNLQSIEFLRFTSFVICLWPEHQTIVTMPWYTSYQEFFFALLFLTIIIWLKEKSVKTAIITGLIAGIVSLINPVPVIFYLAVLCLIVTKSSLFIPRSQTVISFIAFIVAVSPWIIRNYYQLHAFVPLRSNFGVELRQGYNAKASVVQNQFSPHPAVNLQERELYDSLGEIQYTRNALADALKYISENPLHSLKLTTGRVLLFWTSEVLESKAERHSNTGSQNETQHSTFGVFKLLQALLPIFLFAVLIFIKAHKNLPFLPLYCLVICLIPIPAYLTQVNVAYAIIPKMFMLILCCLMVVNYLNRQQRSL